MSINEQRIWGRFRISFFDPEDNPVEVSGELHFDSALNQVPAAIHLVGGQTESLSLMGLMGGLLQIENLSVGETERRTFLGRLVSVSAVHQTAQDDVTRVAEVEIAKAVTEFDRATDAGPSHCSYTYAVDVAGWPASGVFGTSFKGTIEAHEFDDGLHRLLRSDDLNLTATPHYFFRKEGRQLIRQSLASINLEWTREGLDEKRLMDVARLVLSFLYAVKLRPLMKTLASGGKYRRVSWSTSEIETADRDRFSLPISTSDQQNFQAAAIETLYSSGHDIDLLQVITDRYVEARTDVALARSFAHGCEAIEGLYALLKRGAPASAAPDYSQVISNLKAVLESEVSDPDDRAIACSKIEQLFSRPTWPRIKSLIISLASDPCDLIHQVIERSSFFKYRNLSSHGQVVRLDNEVVQQANIMQFVLEWMFIKLCGGTETPGMSSQLLHELSQPETPDCGIIQIWE